MLHKLKGVGLPNVFLSGGVMTEGSGDEQTIAYENLDGLYREISRAIALRPGVMSGAELRFLRKRLDFSQADVARLGGKTEQVVAKWEKGDLPVPKAEASLLRLSALSRFGTKEEIARVVSQLSTNGARGNQFPYVFKNEGGKWTHDDSSAIHLGNQSKAASDVVVNLEPEPSADMLVELVGYSSNVASLLLSISDVQPAGEAVPISIGSSEKSSAQYFPAEIASNHRTRRFRAEVFGGQRHSLIEIPS